MRRRVASFARAEDGATAIEFALVLLPFLLIVYGTIEFGRAMWTREALQSVATETARCMGVRETGCAPSGAYSATSTKSFVTTEAGKLSVRLTNDSVTLNANTACAGITGFSQVSISYTFQTVVPLMVPTFKDGIPFEVSACFPNQPSS